MPSLDAKRSFSKKNMSSYNILSPNQGFSLIELLIALFFIAALTTILLTASGTLFTTRRGKLQTTAARIASKDIEYLRNLTFTSLPIGVTNCAYPELANLPNSTCTRTISDYGNLEILKVKVRVTWNNEDVLDNVTIDTLISRNGL